MKWAVSVGGQELKLLIVVGDRTMSIARIIDSLNPRPMFPQTIHSRVSRLRAKGLVTIDSEKVPSNQPGGPRLVNQYHLTDLGRMVLRFEEEARCLMQKTPQQKASEVSSLSANQELERPPNS